MILVSKPGYATYRGFQTSIATISFLFLSKVELDWEGKILNHQSDTSHVHHQINILDIKILYDEILNYKNKITGGNILLSY